MEQKWRTKVGAKWWRLVMSLKFDETLEVSYDTGTAPAVLNSIHNEPTSETIWSKPAHGRSGSILSCDTSDSTMSWKVVFLGQINTEFVLMGKSMQNMSFFAKISVNLSFRANVCMYAKFVFFRANHCKICLFGTKKYDKKQMPKKKRNVISDQFCVGDRLIIQ